MRGVISAECPHLTAVNFEKTLVSDDLLAHYFNDFLSLPCFPEVLLYNQETGLFEVESGAAEFVSRKIRLGLNHSKSRLLMGDPMELARTPPVDNRYTVRCLDRERGIQWVMKERLHFFLQSDYYYEYRLAKMLFQRSPNLCVQRRSVSSVQTTFSATSLQFSSKVSQEKKNGSAITRLPTYQTEFIYFNSSRCSSAFSSFSLSSNLKYEKPQELHSLSEPLDSMLEEPPIQEPSSQNPKSSELELERLSAKVVQQVLNEAVRVMDGQNQANTCDCFTESREETKCCCTDGRLECKVYQDSAAEDRDEVQGKKEKVQEGNRVRTATEKAEWEKTDGRTQQENGPGVCCHDICCHGNRSGLDEFKAFLQGTPGDKLLNLWMDIERLKTTQNRERKNRYLGLMRSRYLQSSSQSCLHVELLSRLGLNTSPCWTEEKLQSVQPTITESLLFYWVPRFWTSHFVQADHVISPPIGLRTESRIRPTSDISPHHNSITLPLLCPKPCLPRTPHTAQTQFYSSRFQLLGSRRMEQMIQALCSDSCSGLYFTHFCEQSGNQLWEDAVYFWTDLQHYHELFYQDGLDPYRVQREAQLLYSTFLSSSARRSIGVDEEIRREVYNRLVPAFEELFDEAEDHSLNILLEPWTLLINGDKESFQQVPVQEETRRVDSQEYRELQSLYEESERQLKQIEQYSALLFPPVPPSTLFSKGPLASGSWSNVSSPYQGYRLGSLLRHRHEIGHFMAFLQNQDAGVHLACWLDLEQYRRTPQRDKSVRQERSTHISTKYLNRNYFFGPDSPASIEQQNDILRLAGGMERLKLQCLSNPVVMEIQDVVRTHIEETWLPQFLSTEEFIERQSHKPKPAASHRHSQHVHRRRTTRREAWKTNGLWMSSSKEILLFRRILLNPVTCLQFQYFVSLKGDFLENDLLFWLEVQRYKDLCHSHSDEATIQRKISTIISCFINSSMPPSLQIDIPPEQAQHILENRHKLGPYIFREAQMSVFNELLKFWPEFEELRSSVQEEQLLPLLEEKRGKHRARLRRQRRKEEEEDEENERRAREELETQEISFRDKEEVDDDDDEDEAEERSLDRRPSMTQSRLLFSPTEALSWSYSKYMAALKREEVLLKRQSQMDASFSTTSDSSSFCSVGSADLKPGGHRQTSLRSRADSKRNRYSRTGVRACNIK
ncbi:regulator of G-protein signaling 22 [Sphaeramia orbicularis]|uniref:regulator of G-protein signaling 22 n=1 Tax=Sphaeramia orbicularis TaxID=375764 RepID=UPI00117DB624|nr:regulator of G-protein signaling 22 [Sphaeramia orbicularis]